MARLARAPRLPLEDQRPCTGVEEAFAAEDCRVVRSGGGDRRELSDARVRRAAGDGGVKIEEVGDGVTSLEARVTFSPVLLVANPTGLRPAFALGISGGVQVDEVRGRGAMSRSLRPRVGLKTIRKTASAPFAET